MDASANAAPQDPLFLTPAEADLLHGVACRLVEAAATNTPDAIGQYALGRLAEYPLVGVFVTLRKHGELRGCIGNFAASTPLCHALERAAKGVVGLDSRFPRVTADELTDLMLTVSLLHTREQLDGNAQQRAADIVIGRHGLDIQFQGRKGLLLPSVATDHNLDPLTFLQAVCRKAGLPDDAWQDPRATLYRFSAIVLSGPWVARA